MKKEVQSLLGKADHALEVAESLYKQGFPKMQPAGSTMRCSMQPRPSSNQKVSR